VWFWWWCGWPGRCRRCWTAAGTGVGRYLTGTGRSRRSLSGRLRRLSSFRRRPGKVCGTVTEVTDLGGSGTNAFYTLRHAAVSTRLNGGVTATQVASWAGHSVEVLLKVYAQVPARA
jgi:hypothetical protein